MSSTSIGTELDNNKNEMEKPEADNVKGEQASVLEQQNFDEVEEDQDYVPSKRQKIIKMAHR